MVKRSNGGSEPSPSTKKAKGADGSASSGPWVAPAGNVSVRTVNHIRKLVDGLNIPGPSEENPLSLLKLSIGDPTVFGNMKTHPVVKAAVVKAVESDAANGYCPAHGQPPARAAVAAFSSYETGALTADDVILASGCSGALTLAFPAVLSEGDNILLPQPCFSLYHTIAEHYGIDFKQYRLLPERAWEADVAHLESLVDSRTRAILVNNPGNPTGSNYSKEHLLALLDVAKRHRLVVIADEIYGDLVWNGPFHPLASLSKDVPVLEMGGLAKRWLVPGWRLGWICIHDRHNALRDVRSALLRLSQLIIGPNTLIQAALPAIINDTPKAFFDGARQQLRAHAELVHERCQAIPGLRPVVPQGAMYIMVEVLADEFDGIGDGSDFAQQLLNEQHVFTLPGACFHAPSFIRIVVCPPKEILTEALDRIAAFCKKHHRGGAK